MIKLALAVGFLAVFGFTAFAIIWLMTSQNKNDKSTKNNKK